MTLKDKNPVYVFIVFVKDEKELSLLTLFGVYKGFSNVFKITILFQSPSPIPTRITYTHSPCSSTILYE